MGKIYGLHCRNAEMEQCLILSGKLRTVEHALVTYAKLAFKVGKLLVTVRLLKKMKCLE